MENNGYQVNDQIDCIDAYLYPHEKEFDDGPEWSECPYCKQKPKIWTFDNGRSTACGCGKSMYDHFSIHAESIMSVHKRTDGKGMTEYDSDGLRKNWNHWCESGEILFEHAGKREDGRW
jgi:hypothetical protein